MIKLVRGLALLNGLLLLSGCYVFTGKSGSADWAGLRKPDLKLHIFDKTDQDYLFDAQIEVSGSDSVAITNVFSIYGLSNVRGKTIRLHISHPDYLSFDTTISVPVDTVKTIDIAVMSSLVATGRRTDTSSAFIEGWENAQKSIDSNDAYIYRAGGLPADPIMVDQYTGLPIRGNMSCIVDDHILSFARGHNERIKLWIAQNGIPDYSKKKWLSVIMSPKKCYKSSSKGWSPTACCGFQPSHPPFTLIR